MKTVKAIELIPYFHHLVCRTAGDEPKPIEIVHLAWSPAGRVFVGLDTHQATSFDADEDVAVECCGEPGAGPLRRQAEFLSTRPFVAAKGATK